MYRLMLFLLLGILPLFAQDNIVSVNYYEDQDQLLSVAKVHTSPELFFDKNRLIEHPTFDANVTLWLQIVLTNNSDEPVQKVIKFLDIRLDRMDLYDDNGNIITSMGDRVPFGGRVYKDVQIAIDLEAAPHTTTIRYIRFHNEDRSDLSYILEEKSVYQEALEYKKSVHAFFFGGMVVMLFYNIILYIFIRQKVFLTYIIYHTVLLVVMFYYNGLVSQYYRSDAYDVNGGNVPWILGYMAVILAITFLRDFLDVKKTTPRIDKTLQYFIYLILVMIPSQYIGFLPKQAFVVVMMPLSLYLLAISAYYSFFLRNMLAFFYFLGWITMLVAIVITGLLSLGLVERNDLTSDIFQLGTLIEVTLLSMGLAYRYKLTQEHLARQNSVIQEQAKLASMGEMIRHISHQWRQPLAAINSVTMRMDAEHRQQLLNQEVLEHDLGEIEDLTAYMSKTIQDFNSYFKADKVKKRVHLEAVVNNAYALVESTLERYRIDFNIVNDENEEILVYEGELIQVLLVIFNNAIDALVASEVEKRSLVVRIKQEGSVHLMYIEDSAGGIAKEHLNKVFEPYFTTKFEAQGTGIGLYMSKMIIEESMKGRLSVRNTEMGACFIIELR